MSDLALRLIRENIEKHERGEDATRLDLGNCALTEVPKALFKCVWLEELILSSEWWERLGGMSQLWKKSENPHPANNIEQLTSEFSKLVNLTKLILSGNLGDRWKLSDISVIGELPNLQILHINKTKVSDLSAIGKLSALGELDVSDTLVADLNPLSKLADLRVLSVSNTPVNDLNPISHLPNLRRLYARSTAITDLSPISSMKMLRHLNVRFNNVHDLPQLDALADIGLLDLSYTQVSDLAPLKLIIARGMPVRFERTAEMGRGIFVQNCPLTHPPIEIAQQGNAAILRYFDELDKQETLRLYEAKCLIIGEGGAGKTSLVRKLLDRDNKLPEEKETTKGIEVQPLDFILPDGSDFRLHLWDFGGQEIYHATHQFFLTKRSLYVLVDDTRKDEKTVNDPVFSYWFQVVELFGGGSPLLIIQNEKGDRSKQLDLRGMQGRFDFIKESRAANLLTCRGLDEVRRAIEYHISRLPHVGEVLPKQWALIRRALEDLRWGSESEPGRDHISLEEYYALCRRHDIPERERALFLSDYLHDLGAILHFKDNPLLRKIIILNNQWATDAVYKVLDNEPVKKQYGLFTRRDLASIWSDERYQDQQDELLALMEKFEICYQLSDEGEDNWLAPQLLPVEQPDALHWDNTDNLQLRYEYDFMPRGMLSRFIVRMHRYVKNTDLAWRSGVVLERQGALALVTETWGSREIVVRAQGVYAKELVTLIAEDFDRMHQRFENLRFKQLIPCNCPACSAAVKPYFYPYSQLLKMKESRVQEVQCGENFVMVNVVGLLDGVFADLKEGLNRAEVRAWVAAGKTRESLERIADFFEETPMLQAQLANAEKEFRLGKITQEEMMVVSQRVSSTILKWLEN